jgi:hypothetical protein
VGSFRNPSFERMIEGTLKRASAALRDAGIPYCLMGSLAAWVRGGGESSHDLDFGIRACDVLAAAEALQQAGFGMEIPPEEWLVKAWDGAPGGDESTLVDLIYAPSGMPIDDDVLQRADILHVLAQSMPVIGATDLLVMKLSTLREQNLDYTSAVQIARAIREQVDWPSVRERTAHSPYALAFFTMADRLGITGESPGPVSVLADMQAEERRITPEYIKARSRLAESIDRREPANGNGTAAYEPLSEPRSAHTTA